MGCLFKQSSKVGTLKGGEHMLSRYVPAMLVGEGVRTAVTDEWVATYRLIPGSFLCEMSL